jgi:uncharacterized protein YndB with AHSA1/START domain
MPTPVERTVEVVVMKRYELQPERVFDAFLDPKVARDFLFATATATMIRAEIDPRIGGRFTFTERRPDMGEVEHTGEYLEIDRPRRLAFSFGVPQFSPLMTTVAIEIVPREGGCELTLVNDGVLETYAEGSTDGWSRILDGLPAAYDGVHGGGWR